MRHITGETKHKVKETKWLKFCKTESERTYTYGSTDKYRSHRTFILEQTSMNDDDDDVLLMTWNKAD